MNVPKYYEPDFRCGTFKNDQENGISPEIRARMDADRAAAEKTQLKPGADAITLRSFVVFAAGKKTSDTLPDGGGLDEYSAGVRDGKIIFARALLKLMNYE